MSKKLTIDELRPYIVVYNPHTINYGRTLREKVHDWWRSTNLRKRVHQWVHSSEGSTQ